MMSELTSPVASNGSLKRNRPWGTLVAKFFFMLPEKFWGAYSRRHVCPSVRLSVNFHIFDFFSRTTGPILTKLGTNHPWGKGIQVCSNEGQRPSPRGDNSEKAKIH